MLVLTRRAGESIMIGSDVVVRVIEVRGDVVRVGVDAPREVQVHREEVFHAVRAANLEAARTAAAGQDGAALDALRAGLAGRLAGRRPGTSGTDGTPSTSAPAARPGPPRPAPPPNQG